MKRYKLTLLAVIISIILGMSNTHPISAQSISVHFDSLTVEDGLSQSTIWSIGQDDLGYMWFGTDEGLNQYDGQRFSVFKQEIKDPTTILGNTTVSIFKDSRGNMWFGTSSGLNLRKAGESNFIHFKFNPDDKSSLWGKAVLAITEDLNGTIWIGTEYGGLHKYNPVTNTFTHYTHDTNQPDSLSGDNVLSLLVDSSGTLWVGTTTGLDVFDPDTETFAHFKPSALRPEESISSSVITSMIEDHHGNLWIGTYQGGINHYDRKLKKFTHYIHSPINPNSLTNNEVTDLVEDNRGNIWIGTPDGLDVLDPATGNFQHFTHNPNDPFSLTNNYIMRLFKDRAGVIWIGTYGGGVNRYSQSANKFQTYRQIPGDLNSLSDKGVYAIAQTFDGDVWFGTISGGLNRLDRDNGSMRIYRHTAGDDASLRSNEIRSLYIDRAGTLWVGTYDAGISRYNPQTNDFTHFLIDPDTPISTSRNSITAFCEDSQGNFWIGTRNYGLHRLDRATGLVTHYPIPDDAVDRSDFVRVILEDNKGQLWIGTYGGLFMFDPLSGKYLTYFQQDPENINGLNDNRILSLYQDEKGYIWIGTVQGGLHQLNPETDEFIHYTEKDGLANNTVYGILPDKQGNLWLSTNKGVSRFNPRDITFRNFDISDGLQGNEFNAGAYYRTKDGEIFFGGVNGVNSFNPDQMYSNPVPPRVIIRSFMRFNQIERQDLTGGEHLELSYQDNFISFEFAALDYSAPNKNQYAYMLEGFDKEWIYSGTRNYTSYTNLSGGDYVLWVKAANNDGIWNEQGIAITMHVSPPFYESWWFIGLSIIFIGGVVFAGYRFRVLSIETQNRLLERQVTERTQEIERRREVAEGLREIISLLNSNRSLNECLDRIIYQAVRIMGADAAMIYYCPDGKCATVIASNLPAPEQPAGYLVEQLTQTQKPLIIPSIKEYKKHHPGSSFSPFDPFTAIMVQPISMGKGIDGGLVLAYNKINWFTDEDIKTGHTLAEHTTLAIANDHLRSQAQDLAVSAERSRLARDLHDAVTQTLFASTLIADVLPRIWQRNPDEGNRRLNELRQLTRGALAEMRTLLVELRPGALVDASMADLIQQLCDAFNGRVRIPVHCVVQQTGPLPPEVQLAMYRIAQEALNNISKHAHASRVEVILTSTADEVVLTISDNGVGFEMNDRRPNHFGLGIMQERAANINAEINVQSHQGQGTQINIRWKRSN